MGVEYRGAIVLGYTYKEVKAKKERLQELSVVDSEISTFEFAEGMGLGQFAPHFDAEEDYCIFGVEIKVSEDYHFTLVDLNDIAALSNQEAAALESLMGQAANLYLMAEGS